MAETKPEAAPSTDTHEKMGFWRQYIFSIDHKVIGKQYLFLGLFMGYVGVFLSYVFRWQLAWPGTAVPFWGKVTAPQYYEVVTMHGTIMVFFVAMPVLLGAFGNFLIPLMVGARDPEVSQAAGLPFGPVHFPAVGRWAVHPPALRLVLRDGGRAE